jgi:hypothetical protein
MKGWYSAPFPAKRKRAPSFDSARLFARSGKVLFADAEHLGAADWASALGSWLTILHGNGFGGFHFPLGAALDAIRLHSVLPPFFYLKSILKQLTHACQ